MMRQTALLALIVILLLPRTSIAQSASSIQTQINDRTAQIASLEAEIAAFQKQLDEVGVKKNTLQSVISSLGISQQQLTSQIKVTEAKVSFANLEIEKLSISIGDKESTISENQAAIAKALRSIAEGEQESIITQLVSSQSIGDAWKVADAAVEFNRALSDNIDNLRATRAALASNRDEVSATKATLVLLKSDLTLQKRSVDANKTTQQKLLTDTKNLESNYQKQISEKQAAEKAFEQELVDLQGQLDLIVHPNLLPKVGSGVLSWPFSDTFMLKCTTRKNVFGNFYCITQFFGNTPFSTANPQIYNGHGHNAIDIGAPIGTPVQAAMSGTVLATGNTDNYRGCYSFGKWIMIIHGNGLNTLYSHLSSIDVDKGQYVSRGQVIGLSGMTGYATGPHLHFGVYATEGTQIMTLGQFRGGSGGCANANMPVATLTAYLNPLSYL